MCIGCSCAILYFESLKRIPLSIAGVIVNIKGLIVLVLSIIFLEDRITAKAVLCIVICFIGTVLLIRPSVFVGPEFSPDDQSLNHFSQMNAGYFFGCILAIGASLAKAGINVWIRKFSSTSSTLIPRNEHFADA